MAMDIKHLDEIKRVQLIDHLNRDEALLTEAQYDRYMALRQAGLSRRRLRALGLAVLAVPVGLAGVLALFAGLTWLGGRLDETVAVAQQSFYALRTGWWDYFDWRTRLLVVGAVAYFAFDLYRNALGTSNLQAAVEAMATVHEEAAPK